MRHRFFEVAFTPAVQAEQQSHGSRAAYATVAADAEHSTVTDVLSQREVNFIQARDSFYLATVSETGWPYVQHRGGPIGFVRLLDDRTLGWAEFAGNLQYVSIGNGSVDDRVAMIFMDYPKQRRLKILGHLHTHEPSERPDLVLRLSIDNYDAQIERFVTIDVEAFDWNCPQHITPRFTLAEMEGIVAPLRAKIGVLEDRLAKQTASATLFARNAASVPQVKQAQARVVVSNEDAG